MRKWTKAQTDAINSREGTVIVSAAAGSGKTSVLVERLIQRICDTEKGSAEKLLVVTFTNAAAKEMKERVEMAIADKIKAEPSNKHLKKQQMLVSSMNVSTVHSFCSRLCREYFYMLDIAPDYNIIPEKQRTEMLTDAFNELMGRHLSENDTLLADLFSSDKDDTRLFETLVSFYEFSNTHLYPQKWMTNLLNNYDDSINIEETIWGRQIVNLSREIMKFCIKLCEDNLQSMQEDEEIFTKYQPMVVSDKLAIESALDSLNTEVWEQAREKILSIKFITLATVKGRKGDALLEKSKAIRDNVKAQIGKVKDMFEDDTEFCQKTLRETKKIANKLSQMTLEFGEIFWKLKKEKKFLDYSDLEHMTIKLLLSEKDGIIVPSEIARNLSERFDEVMIDEYQDTNEVQDEIFRALSKDDGNKFMVGDLKQCIYSFRQAKPDIFINYKESFERFNSENPIYPATIVLDQNFRSRDNVINTVNFIFETLMSKKSGGVDYIGDEALRLGASYEDGGNYDTRLDFLEKKPELATEITEARHIANMIKEIIASGLLVGSERRKVNFGDFAILLRSANSVSPTYEKELEALGVPAKAQMARPFFEASEILQFISLLQVIDNPNQDVPLLSVLLGPIYGYEASELAVLRKEDKQNSLYVSITQDESGKFETFLNDMERFRLLSSHMPSHVFIDNIFQQTSYLEIVSAMQGGEARVSNLRLLRNYASDYENSGYKGLSSFVRFMDRLMKTKSNLEGASLNADNANVVKIMSIHKSKGLEFPVCIVAGCGRKKKNETNDLVISSELGIACRIKDEFVKYNNFIRESIIRDNRMKDMSEELRILYVAATRAREKLIFVSTLDNCEKTATNVSSLLDNSKTVSSHGVKNVTTVAEWLLMCSLKHPNGNILRSSIGIADDIVNFDNFSKWDINIVRSESENLKETEIEDIIKAEPDLNLYSELKEKLDFFYERKSIPVKVTASAVVKRKSEKSISLNRPAFLSFKGLTPAERGIAVHSFIQFCNLEKAMKSVSAERDRLVKEGFITNEQGQALNFKRITNFLYSDIGKSLINAEQKWRELRFSAKIPASYIDDEYQSDTKVILQGAVDCAFIENDRLYIIDFKTDRVEDEQDLVKEYAVQLNLYAKALQEVKKTEIGGCFLYSFYLNRAIRVDDRCTSNLRT